MKAWLKKKFRDWAKEAWETDNGAIAVSSKGSLSRNQVESEPTLNFRVYNAVGGQIVEFSKYNSSRDRHETDLYIIKKDEDFGERIAQIANLEIMKQ